MFQAILDKGTALTQKPKSPEFLGREVKLKFERNYTCKINYYHYFYYWTGETGRWSLEGDQQPGSWQAESSERYKILFALKHPDEYHIKSCFSDNQAAWERYEQKRDELTKKLDGADAELENINQVLLPCKRFVLTKICENPDAKLQNIN